jgi:hypothetical protein
MMPLGDREGAVSRLILKPESLPVVNNISDNPAGCYLYLFIVIRIMLMAERI